MKKITLIAFLTIMIAATSGWAKNEDNEELQLISTAKVNLTQAIENALSSVPGQALSAEFDDHENPPVFVVEIINKGQTYEVTLDIQSGQVLTKHLDREDKDDRDGEDKD